MAAASERLRTLLILARRPARWVAVSVIIGLSGACSEAPPSSTPIPAQIEGLDIAWDFPGVHYPQDVQFFAGDLFILAGRDSAQLWRLDLSTPNAPPERIHTRGLPPGRPRLLESNDFLMYVAGDWGPAVFATRADGTIVGEPRFVTLRRDFTPWPTGEFLQAGDPSRPALLVEALVPTPRSSWRRIESASGWGNLPRTENGPLQRGDRPPLSDALLARDQSNQLHVALNAASALIQYNSVGDPTLVRRLPVEMLNAGRESSDLGYGQPIQAVFNSLEETCGGNLWVSVGEDSQIIGVFDTETYRLKDSFVLTGSNLRDALWTECSGWIVGLSSKGGRLVVGQRRQSDRW